MYDFDKVTPRRGTDSEKWDDCNPDVLPMWIADMDFQVAPFIIDAIQRKVDLAAVASAFGLPDVRRAHTPEGIRSALDGREGFRFIHVPIKAFNSDSPNIPLTAAQIRDRFMSAL